MSIPTATKDIDDGVNIQEYISIVMRRKKMILGVFSVVAIAALATSLLLPPTYSSKATLLPPQQQSSSVSALMGQLGGLAGAAGSLAGLKNPNDLYVGMLQSRTVADNIIARYKLEERYKQDSMQDTRKAFEKKRRITSGKDGMISIEVDDKDPKVAADIANAHVDELMVLTKTFAITEASQRRLFFEKQLKLAKEELANAELALRKTQENTGMLQLSGQVQGIIASMAQLKGVIASKEVEAASMRTFATGQNPALVRVNEELRSLRGQLEKLQAKQDGKDGGLLTSTGNIPEVGLEYVRKLRDVKYYETVFELLAKQFEMAKIDEAKDTSTIQQLDKAIPADKNSGPKRLMIALAGLAGGLLLGIMMAIFYEKYLPRRNVSVVSK
ncbi:MULTISPECIES: GumC family protein [unclassified Janthinobacterium]|uniref:GumC family protein n=1 Tax=unclassified Janthinobacterium TaxID=2610881 RepID=UPI000627CD6E|nr:MULTISPECIES: Wzz/FepE/Etk N-terminal domain-containing protein [unclassified Janthinobacterium]